MNISINCKLSLSKKLKALVGKEATLTLVSQDIADGKGTAILTLTSDGTASQFEPNMGETSIMLVPVELAEESLSSSSPVHASIFSTVPSKHKKESVVQKIAAVNAPEKGEEPTAIKEEADVPEAFSEVKDPECSVWVKNMEELANAVSAVKHKKSEIEPENAKSVREKAVLQELKEKAEAIEIPAWIVNDKVGSLSINDLNIGLPLNAPFNLSSISARRIALSKDLRGLLKAGYVRFISPKEKDRLLSKESAEETTQGLEVFDHHDEVLSSIENSGTSSNPVIDDKTAMFIDEADIANKTEEENMILDLTQGMPATKTKHAAPVVNHRTVHNNTASSPKPKNPAIKSVKRLE